MTRFQLRASSLEKSADATASPASFVRCKNPDPYGYGPIRVNCHS
jgi:hypothetical protein